MNLVGYRICHIDTTAAENCYNVVASKEKMVILWILIEKDKVFR